MNRETESFLAHGDHGFVCKEWKLPHGFLTEDAMPIGERRLPPSRRTTASPLRATDEAVVVHDDHFACHSQSLLWSIPVAGPWAANFSSPPDERVPTLFVAAWSGLEAASLAMIIVGAIGHDVTLNIPSATPAKASVVPLVTAQAGMLSLRTSW
jgi:hypothetical protein